MRLDLALVGLILLMIWSFVGLRLVEERADLEQGAVQAGANIAGAAEQGIARTIEAMDQRLRFVRDAYRRDPEGFSLDFLSHDSGYNDSVVMQVALIGADGRLTQTNLGPTDGTLDLSDRPHFRIHLTRSDDLLYISAPVLGRVSGRWSVQFTRKLYGPDGHFAGVVVCSLDPYWLTQFHELLDISGNMLLLGEDGIVRAAAPNVAMLGRDLSGTPLGRAIAEDAGSLRMAAAEQTPEQIVSFRRMRNYPLTVAVGMDLAPILAAYHQSFLVTVSVGAWLTLLVLLAGALLIRHKRRLIASRELLWHAIENLDQGLVMVDPAGRISLRNSRYLALLDLPPGLAEPGADYAALVEWQAARGEFGPVAARMSVPELLTAFTRTEVPGLRFKERIRPDGTALEIRMRLLADGGMVSTFTDITERRRAEAEIHHLAHHDGLTDLANRVLLEERLGQALALAERGGGAVAVHCVDLDRFKLVNDVLGHSAGDRLLQETARRLRAVARASDIVARVDGDEFVLVQTAVSQPADAEALAERIMTELALPHDLDGHAVSLEASIGIAIHPHDGTTAESLLKNADTALHRAKASGRGFICFFESEMGARLRERSQLERDLRLALAEGGIALHFQPLHACATREVTAYEALLRWHHPVRGPVSPAEFIPVAEETGLILPLARWVLEEACAAAAAWERPCTVAVNLSPVQFRRGNLPALVAEVLASTGLPAHRLELEVTEGLLIEDAEGALEIMRALKAQGVRLALDDFGTGYSSLSYLRRFPFDKLKIDKSFTQAIGADPGAQVIVEAILAMGQSLKLRVTAEGVETEEQLDFLRRQGCDEVQGFLLGRPVPAGQIPGRAVVTAGMPAG
ncbi:bifunctional diguanylate cyclase/phosphodiesterase [Muricoccus roseus]|uniref:bifunctional diguanylate cyclase/phosphodiesterase n=1 Tax=Muricoccus roseus TaxID=198092 RepID=UPI00111499A0|nr:EAL domain-containing protein [Roseomonas rosea]